MGAQVEARAGGPLTLLLLLLLLSEGGGDGRGHLKLLASISEGGRDMIPGYSRRALLLTSGVLCVELVEEKRDHTHTHTHTHTFMYRVAVDAVNVRVWRSSIWWHLKEEEGVHVPSSMRCNSRGILTTTGGG